MNSSPVVSAPPLSPAWHEGPWLGFDTETTGVRVTSDRLVTVALVLRADGRDEQMTWLADPGVEIPAGATAIHGVTTEQARREGQLAREVAEEVATALAAALRDGIPIVAFNAPYDLTLLDAELRRYGLATLTERVGGPVGPVLDPLAIDRGLHRYRRGKRTLDVLCGHFGIAIDVAMHRAENDAELTLDLLEAMVVQSGALAQMSLAELHAHQTAWHRAWAENFNLWLSSQGRTPDAGVEWPVADLGRPSPW